MEASRLATMDEQEMDQEDGMEGADVNLVINYKNGALGFSALGLTALGYCPPPTTSWGDWMAAGQIIRAFDRFKNFAIGDWIASGERKWGEKYAQALDEFQWGNMNKLSKLVWVAKSVPLQNRRADLTWTHHMHVAALPVELQADWLSFAALNELTANELKLQIKANNPVEDDEDGVVTIDHDGAPDAGMPVAMDSLFDEPVGGGAPQGIPAHTSANEGWDNQRSVLEGDERDDYGVEMDHGEDGDRPTLRVQVPDNPRKAANVLFGTFGKDWCLSLIEAMGTMVADEYLD